MATDMGSCIECWQQASVSRAPPRKESKGNSEVVVAARRSCQKLAAPEQKEDSARPPLHLVSHQEEEARAQRLDEVTRQIEALAQRVEGCVSGLDSLSENVNSLPARVVDEWAAASGTASWSLLSAGKRNTHHSLEVASQRSQRSQRSVRSLPTHSPARACAEELEAQLEVRFSPRRSGGSRATTECAADIVVVPMQKAKTSVLSAEASLGLRSFKSFRTLQLSPAVRMLLRPRKGVVMQALWRFLEEPDSGKCARLFHATWVPLIFFSIIASLLQSVEHSGVEGRPAWLMEIIFDACFAAEGLARMVASPNLQVFFCSFSNVVDVLAGLPLVGRLLLGPEVMPRAGEVPQGLEPRLAQTLVCLSPTLRLLKTLRRFQQFHLFLAILRFTQEALQFLLLTLVLIVLLFSALIYFVEQGVNSDIPTLPQSMWLTVVTLTTVGYGDVTPQTRAGHLICLALILGSVLFMAMPIGIIGNAFTEKWKDRDRIMMNHRFQDRILQCGYTAQDVVPMFAQFDVDRNGELSLSEFVEMVVEMQLGLQEDSAIHIFEMIDKNGSGGIDCREFVREFFPSKFFHEIYGHQALLHGDWLKEKAREYRERDRRERGSARRRSTLGMPGMPRGMPSMPGRTSERAHSKRARISKAEAPPQGAHHQGSQRSLHAAEAPDCPGHEQAMSRWRTDVTGFAP